VSNTNFDICSYTLGLSSPYARSISKKGEGTTTPSQRSGFPLPPLPIRNVVSVKRQKGKGRELAIAPLT